VTPRRVPRAHRQGVIKATFTRVTADTAVPESTRLMKVRRTAEVVWWFPPLTAASHAYHVGDRHNGSRISHHRAQGTAARLNRVDSSRLMSEASMLASTSRSATVQTAAAVSAMG